jgi:hypothetical protein
MSAKRKRPSRRPRPAKERTASKPIHPTQPLTHHVLLAHEGTFRETIPTADLPLTGDEIAVLLALAAHYPRTMTHVDLYAAVRVSRNTIGECLRVLRERHLVSRPKGERGGDQLTPWGLKRAGKLREQELRNQREQKR